MSGDAEREIEKVRRERDEYLRGWKRAKADLINERREALEAVERAVERVKSEQLLLCLPVLDNLELAESGLTAKQKKDPAVAGFLRIVSTLRSFLEKQGVNEVEVSKGDEFDPSVHEAVEETRGGKANTVSEVVQKGYERRGVLLRPAKVKVNA